MIAWIDLETTGIDTECSIIEVACVVTNDEFKTLRAKEWLVQPVPHANAEQGAIEMHKKSGLWADALLAEKNIWQVDRELAAFLMEFQAQPILGGSSVHFDRRFMERWMDDSVALLHYRNFDVSVIKNFVSMCYGVEMDALPPLKSKTTHRAMDDIKASIEAARWYKANLLFSQNP